MAKKEPQTRTPEQREQEAQQILKNTGGENGGVKIGRVQSTPNTQLGTPAHPRNN